MWAFETSRRAGASSRGGGPACFASGAPSGRRFLRYAEERDVFSLHENLWPGDSPGPPQRHSARHKDAARHGPSPEPPQELDGERVLAASKRRCTAFPQGLIEGSDPRHEGRGCANTLAPMPYRAFGEGGRSPPRPEWLLSPRRVVRQSRKTLPCRADTPCRPVCITRAPKCASTPIVSFTPPIGNDTSGLPVEASPGEPNRPPCIDAFRQPSARPPARALLKGDGVLQGGLQAAVLVQDPDIPSDDGLLDPGDLAPHLLADLGRARIPLPAGQHPARPTALLPSPDDRYHFDLEAQVPERLPEIAVLRAPRTERRRGPVARFGVDEDGALRVQRDGQAEREEAPEAPERAPVDPLGKSLRSIPSASKAATRSASVGSHGRRGCSST